jgi:hypothetical protein
MVAAVAVGGQCVWCVVVKVGGCRGWLFAHRRQGLVLAGIALPGPVYRMQCTHACVCCKAAGWGGTPLVCVCWFAGVCCCRPAAVPAGKGQSVVVEVVEQAFGSRSGKCGCGCAGGVCGVFWLGPVPPSRHASCARRSVFTHHQHRSSTDCVAGVRARGRRRMTGRNKVEAPAGVCSEPGAWVAVHCAVSDTRSVPLEASVGGWYSSGTVRG